MNLNEISAIIERESAFIKLIKREIAKNIVGQTKMIDAILISILSGGHLLIEGLPGLAKTLAVKTFAEAARLEFRRIQFTPDLLPSDITGAMVYNPQRGDFSIKRGPVFTNILLADEINRAPAKTQSALLEAMQEKQATIGDASYKFDEPFVTLATQNPIEHEGAYVLPEAQSDRFALKILVSYPDKTEELEILRRSSGDYSAPIYPVATAEEFNKAKKIAKNIYIDERLEKYIVDIVFASRNPEKYGLGSLEAMIKYGASPRATISLALASKAKAFIEGRAYVSPEDIRDLAADALRHRIYTTFEADADEVTSVDIINQILNKIKIP